MLTILAHPEPERVGERAWLGGAETDLSRAEPDFGGNGPLRDRYLSRKPVRISRAGALGVTVSARDTRMDLTVDGARVDGAVTLPAARLEDGVVLGLSERVALLLHRRKTQEEAGPTLGLLGVSEAVEAVRREVLQVADLDVPVLVRGESGVGKELVAQAIHAAGPRRSGPCQSVNMAAVPSTLAASELFGHVRGAFSGAAADHDGYFAQADGGTLFLDEVGDTPADVQAMLLRALETGEIRPVGGNARQVDVRLVAATDADLEGAVAAGRFRAPLLHRLSGYRIDIAPLRARRDDVGVLFFHFVRAELDAVGRPEALGDRAEPFVPADLVTTLARSEWPGNVRQLRNVARQLVIANRHAEVMAWQAHVERLLPTAPASVAPEQAPAKARYRKAGEVEEEELLAALRANAFRLKPTAEALGISRTALYGLVEQSGRVRKAVDLEVEEVQTALASAAGDLDAAAMALEVSRQALSMRMGQLGLALR